MNPHTLAAAFATIAAAASAGAFIRGGWKASARRRALRKADAKAAESSPPARPATTPSAVPRVPSHEEQAIAELVQVEPVFAFDATLAVEVPLNAELSRSLGMLSSIVGRANGTVPAAITCAGGQLYELCFTPEITRQLSDGTLVLQKAIGEGYRSGAVGPNGRYVAQGRLVKAGEGSRKLATVAAASFQVISFVVGQEHLAQINAKLEKIASSIENLRRERQIEREAEILAFSKGLHEDVELLLRGELDEAGQAKVIDRLRETDQLFDKIEHLVDTSLDRLAGDLRDTSLRKGMFQRLGQTSANLIGKFDELATWRRLDVLATNLLAYAAQVSLALPLRDPYSVTRMERLQRRLNRPNIDFRAFAARRIELDLKSVLSLPAQRRDRQIDAWVRVREIENQFEVARDRLIERHAEIEGALLRKAAQVEEGLRLVVEMGDDGAVRRVFRAQPRPATLLEAHLPDEAPRVSGNAGNAARGAAGE
ncbi:hypothetical protein [Trinickia soli]|uniref:Uncharacterized protein n=1 Tax=Trinickia soli TaxID=380675 RepID=A0A2N7W7A2_9BURK|nr:hypothetical protein [Trinickia soli]PMS25286.1 hypothetical protein C0Z19_10055 [Trinickia soli]CAB3688322.1 hypothetical protein LMG24076_02795 [Trinickia soli]